MTNTSTFEDIRVMRRCMYQQTSLMQARWVEHRQLQMPEAEANGTKRNPDNWQTACKPAPLRAQICTLPRVRSCHGRDQSKSVCLIRNEGARKQFSIYGRHCNLYRWFRHLNFLYCFLWLVRNVAAASQETQLASFDGGLGDACCALCRDGGRRRHLKRF